MQDIIEENKKHRVRFLQALREKHYQQRWWAQVIFIYSILQKFILQKITLFLEYLKLSDYAPFSLFEQGAH